MTSKIGPGVETTLTVQLDANDLAALGLGVTGIALADLYYRCWVGDRLRLPRAASAEVRYPELVLQYRARDLMDFTRGLPFPYRLPGNRDDPENALNQPEEAMAAWRRAVGLQVITRREAEAVQEQERRIGTYTGPRARPPVRTLDDLASMAPRDYAVDLMKKLDGSPNEQIRRDREWEAQEREERRRRQLGGEAAGERGYLAPAILGGDDFTTLDLTDLNRNQSILFVPATPAEPELVKSVAAPSMTGRFRALDFDAPDDKDDK